jgi:hypothetical protein
MLIYGCGLGAGEPGDGVADGPGCADGAVTLGHDTLGEAWPPEGFLGKVEDAVERQDMPGVPPGFGPGHRLDEPPCERGPGCDLDRSESGVSVGPRV